MRSPSRALLAAAALAASACGTWSNEDIAFVEALPTAAALRLALPAAEGRPLCAGLGESQVWLGARSTGASLNGGVESMLRLVDTVRSFPPSTRRADERVWGPFDDERHPGKEIRVTMTRRRDGAGVPTYGYAFEARPRGGAFRAVLDGEFSGASARQGRGSFTLRFPVLRALGMNERATDPEGDVAVAYDRAGDPRTVTVGLAQDGFGLTAFDYAYAGYEAGQGSFFFQLTDGQGRRLVVDTRFTPAGAGRAVVAVTGPGGGGAAYEQCWDEAACLTAVRDPLGVSGLCAGASCPAGPCPP